MEVFCDGVEEKGEDRDDGGLLVDKANLTRPVDSLMTLSFLILSCLALKTGLLRL